MEKENPTALFMCCDVHPNVPSDAIVQCDNFHRLCIDCINGSVENENTCPICHNKVKNLQEIQKKNLYNKAKERKEAKKAAKLQQIEEKV